jgi:hypothetical protein
VILPRGEYFFKALKIKPVLTVRADGFNFVLQPFSEKHVIKNFCLLQWKNIQIPKILRKIRCRKYVAMALNIIPKATYCRLFHTFSANFSLASYEGWKLEG